MDEAKSIIEGGIVFGFGFVMATKNVPAGKVVSISSPLTAAEKVERYAREHGLSMSKSWPARALADFLGVSLKTIDRMTGTTPPVIAFLKTEGKRLFHPADIIRYVDRRTVKAA